MVRSDKTAEVLCRYLIFTADDFGLNQSVNEAVELAHQKGVLTCASLMVGAPGAADAIQRARHTPTLATGLHLVLSNGLALSIREQIPHLVDETGSFSDNMVTAGFRYFFSHRVRQQLEHEIRAQFKAFEATRLPLDHVNVHKHFHCHPTLFSLIVRIGQDYGMRAIRLPAEPLTLALGVPHHVSLLSRLQPAALWPLTHWMRIKMRRARLFYNDYIIGLSASGRMTAEFVLELLPHLPAGTGEVYFHPTMEPGLSPAQETANGHFNSDLNALLDPRIPDALNHWSIKRRSFYDAA